MKQDELRKKIEEITEEIWGCPGGEHLKSHIDDLVALFTEQLKEVEARARIDLLHRVGDVLAWCVSKGHIEMVDRNLEDLMGTLRLADREKPND